MTVTKHQYTPNTLTVWVSPPASSNAPDSILVFNPCVRDTIITPNELIFNSCSSDTSYLSTEFRAWDSEIAATFTFPDGYLAVFYPPNTYIYNYRIFKLEALLHY